MSDLKNSMENINFYVEEFECPSCNSVIEKIFKKVDGVVEYFVDILNKTLSLTFDSSKISISEIIELLQKNGYSPKLV